MILSGFIFFMKKPVKIRPKWDWNLGFRVFLKDFVVVKIRPKWDWNTKDYFVFFITVYQLKSDQNGIEIWMPWRSPAHQRRVKIRPKWDWNHNTYFVVPKCLYVKIRPKWDWNLGFRVFLKDFVVVKIRPKWDWNTKDYFVFFITVYQLKSDQNGIEIWMPWRSPAHQRRVKIRPKWDWNHNTYFVVPKCLYVKIRPKWDWNEVVHVAGGHQSR